MRPTPSQSIGRLGFAADNVLFFGTGGLAYGHVDADGKVVLNDVDLWDGGQSQTNWGWTIGGGLEYEFDNFIIGAEYLYVDRWKSRFGGRPKVPLEIRRLIWDMSLANPLWGAPRQLTDACGWEAAPDYIVRDRDCAYGEAYAWWLRAMGIRDRPTAPRSPWQNAYLNG